MSDQEWKERISQALLTGQNDFVLACSELRKERDWDNEDIYLFLKAEGIIDD